LQPLIHQRPAVRAVLACIGEAAAAFGVLFIILEGWRRDFRVPLIFSHDALEYLMQVKGTIENGWWWVHPRLSAPGVFRQIDYPSNTNVDQAIVWFVQLFTNEPGLCINVSWMIMVVLSALIASRCLRVLGLSRGTAIPIGLLFAMSPYALARNIDHFSLATYLVPVPCAVALLVATGRLGGVSRLAYGALAIGCTLIGFNYTYYAFFGSFVILAAAVVAFGTNRPRREFAGALTFVGLICVATALNLAPSLYSWSEHGKPSGIPEKSPAEAEQYGLKIRQLVSPAVDHSFPLFERWTNLETDAAYPLETENRDARLGLVGTAGFLVLLAGFFVPRLAEAFENEPLFANAGRLILAALLLATVGGFGSLFNLLVSPEIRGYNRIVPFISYFSLIAIGLLAGRVVPRLKPGSGQIALAALLLLGLYDQSQAANALNSGQDDIRRDWVATGDFVHSLEDRLPAGAMIFQLPVLTYQTETGRERMLPNDHVKPYVRSSRIHWSFPALDNAIVRWQQRVGRLPGPMLATALDEQGFAAILIDRYGYPDGGQAILSDLGVGPSPDGLLAESARYIALDLKAVRHMAIPGGRLAGIESPSAASTTGLSACDGTTASNLEWIGAASAPFDRTSVRVSSSGAFSVVGWAVDSRGQALAGDVDIVIGDRAFPTIYGLDRPDVASYLNVPGYIASGFSARLGGSEIGEGERRLSIRILAADRRCYYQGPSVLLLAR
jgi:phosphoglycerol transferase